MGAQIRELRRRIKSAGAIKKITKAQELIATSRIAKAQARVVAARPYATEITNVLTALADDAALDHPLLVERPEPKRTVCSSCRRTGVSVADTTPTCFVLPRSCTRCCVSRARPRWCTS
ncbi:F0F1 ATP synthase subunit gamma [Mycobacteroides abscessus]